MKLFAINGSPRKNWNTATLLNKVIEGAKANGAETELIHLYDYNYKGCVSCFACKLKDSDRKGKCAMKDDLTPILKRIEDQADAIVFGTPIYFGGMTGEMRSFFERLLFAPIVYSMPAQSLFPRQIRAGIIYTMNATEEMSKQRGYSTLITTTESYLKMVFGFAETLCCYDTYQFPDYSKVIMEYFDPIKKAEIREKMFPIDCERAYDFGKRMVETR